jgi:hypothetical protein
VQPTEAAHDHAEDGRKIPTVALMVSHAFQLCSPLEFCLVFEPGLPGTMVQSLMNTTKLFLFFRDMLLAAASSVAMSKA